MAIMGNELKQKIIAMDAWHCSVPVNARRDHGIGSVQGSVDVVIVRLTSESGEQGYGEASPWPVFCGTAESSMAAFNRYFVPHVIGASVADMNKVMRSCEKCVVHSSDAKAALETAWLDLTGKLLSVPVHALLGGKVRDTIALSVSIANPDFEQDKLLAQRIHADGIRYVKVKTGFKDHGFDVMRIEWLKEHYPEFTVRVDYNQGLDPFNSVRVLQDIDALDVSFIEQPVAARHWQHMRKLRQAISTPLLADESVFTPTDMLRAVREEICDAVSVKIMKCGGPVRGKEIAAIAEAAGLAAYGGDMFETGVAHLAGVHMIASSPNISLGCEFYQASYYLEEDLLANDFPIQNGMVVVPEGPGLGIEVDEERIRKYAVAHG